MSENKQRGRKAGVKTVPTNETKAEKFTRLGNKRLNKVLNAVRQLKNLSSPAYESKPEQVKYISDKLVVAVNDTIKAFEGKTEQNTEKIELPV